jgi:hypothetical protein
MIYKCREPAASIYEALSGFLSSRGYETDSLAEFFADFVAKMFDKLWVVVAFGYFESD